MVERVAYVDTSALLAVAFDEQGGADLAQQIAGFSRLVSSNLLEAELRAAFAREDLAFPPAILSGIEWILPDRVLTPEFATALQAGYLWGADLWHVATALYISRLIPETSRSFRLTLSSKPWFRRLGFGYKGKTWMANIGIMRTFCDLGPERIISLLFSDTSSGRKKTCTHKKFRRPISNYALIA